jgi:hypothetical protein
MTFNPFGGHKPPLQFVPGNKKAPTHKEKGPQNGCVASHFSQADDA